MNALGTGDVSIDMKFKVSKQKRCVMRNVLYVPDLTCNLFSVRSAVSKGNIVKFDNDKCWVRSAKGTLIGMGSLVDRVYKLNCEALSVKQKATCEVALEECNLADIWHRKLSHLGRQQLRELICTELAKSVKGEASELSFCESCIEEYLLSM